jgi:phosphoribosylglycinamide formyltransferase-1
VNHYEGRILNIHPALLPLYPGLNTHQRVLDAGDEHHGSTVHFVTEELDGGPRILQGRLTVAPTTDPDELMSRVQAVEHQIYPTAADWFGQGRLKFHNGSTYLDDKPLEEPVIKDFD